jgi:hypothetical protein
MPVKQYRGSAAEFRCQFPAAPVLGPGIPLPDGLAKWCTRPCYRRIIRRWRGDFPLSNANFSLPAGKNRKFYEVARRPALKQFVREETLPGSHVQTDDELLDYARRNGSTCYHASCTCMMGSHPTNVVDSELRVHGIDALRVIDASVMPAVTSTNTNAPTIMIATKGAAMIRAAARQRLAA